MKSYSVCYIKDKTLEDIERLAGGERKLRMTFGSINVHPDSPWLECSYRKDDSPPSDEALFGETSVIDKKSEIFGEMIFLFADTSDSFYYEHAHNGVLLRKLSWFPLLDDDWTPGWICVQGEPEPWESDFFFNEKALLRTIEEERSLYDFEKRSDYFPSREKEIRQIWENRKILTKTVLPKCDGTVAMHVEKVFELKHKENPWKPISG